MSLPVLLQKSLKAFSLAKQGTDKENSPTVRYSYLYVFEAYKLNDVLYSFLRLLYNEMMFFSKLRINLYDCFF